MEPTIRKPSSEEKEQAQQWPIWEKEESEFPWEYTQPEKCLIIEGEFVVTNEEGKEFHASAGDYVVFPAGMKCRWDITKAVKKHYQFG